MRVWSPQATKWRFLSLLTTSEFPLNLTSACNVCFVCVVMSICPFYLRLCVTICFYGKKKKVILAAMVC